MKDTEAALKWIVAILEKHNVPYQIAGGFAARLYGATRELADIDIDVPDDCFAMVREDVSPYIILGPERYVDENWDLQLMTLEYKGQLIDISGDAKIYDQESKEWVDNRTDFSNSNPVTIYDITVPVIPKEKLVAYKSKLMREVDKEDIKMLTA